MADFSQLPESDHLRMSRSEMVRTQLRERGIRDAGVLGAMSTIPRHLFVPKEERALAYGDFPLPIGLGQTISQPFIVAKMSELAALKGSERVLEIGTGCGYQTAVLAALAKIVYSIEILPALAARARVTLSSMGIHNAFIRTGDGYAGDPENGPFDVILVTAAPDHIPEPLVKQLAGGGRMVIPVGRLRQEVFLLTRTSEGIRRESILQVRFVPLIRNL